MKKIKKPCGFHCVRIRDIGVQIGGQVILEHVSLHLHCGELLAVIGRNGAGKSTLVRAILDDVAHTGSVEFRDTENGGMQKIRIGYVPQSLELEPNTPMDVYDLIASFRYDTPVFLRKRRVCEEIAEALAEFEAEDLIDRRLSSLSGGELQRVLLSLAVMDRPNLLLLDEPLSGIDKNGMDLFYEKADDLRKNYDMAILLISHDLDYVAKYADRVVLMDKTVLAEGSPAEVFSGEAFRHVFGSAGPDAAKGAGSVLARRRARRTPEKEERYEAGYNGRSGKDGLS